MSDFGFGPSPRLFRKLSMGALFAMSAGVPIGVFGVVAESEPLQALALGLASVGLLTFVAANANGGTILHPLVLCAVPIFVGGVARQAVFATQSDREVEIFLLGFDQSVLVVGALLTFCSVAATVAGFLAPMPNGVRRTLSSTVPQQPTSGVSYDRLVRVGLIVVGISAMASVLYLERLGLGLAELTARTSAKRRADVGGEQGAALGYHLHAASLVVFWLMFALPRSWRNRSSQSPLLGLLMLASVLLLVLLPVVNSARTSLLVNLLLLFAASSRWGSRFRTTNALALVGLALVAFLILGTVRATGSGDSPAEGARGVRSLIVGTHNWAGPGKAGAIVESVPERVDFFDGRSYYSIVAAPIPRAIWPSKPSVRVGTVIGEDIFRLGRDGRTGLPPGLPGELYLNFGLPGVIGGSVLFGLGLRWIFEIVRSPYVSEARRAAAGVAMIHLGLRLPGGDFVGVAIPVLMGAISAALVGWSVRIVRPSPRQSRSGAQLLPHSEQPLSSSLS